MYSFNIRVFIVCSAHSSRLLSVSLRYRVTFFAFELFLMIIFNFLLGYVRRPFLPNYKAVIHTVRGNMTRTRRRSTFLWRRCRYIVRTSFDLFLIVLINKHVLAPTKIALTPYGLVFNWMGKKYITCRAIARDIGYLVQRGSKTNRHFIFWMVVIALILLRWVSCRWEYITYLISNMFCCYFLFILIFPFYFLRPLNGKKSFDDFATVGYI